MKHILAFLTGYIFQVDILEERQIRTFVYMPVFLLYSQNRLFTFAYGDIPYKDVCYVSTTHRVGLDTDNTVQFGAVHPAVLYPYIMASSGYFASYGYSCMSVFHAAFTYDDVFAGNVPVTTVFIASRFYGYAVVARVKVAVFYQHVFARFRIASVIVRTVALHFHTFYGYVFRQQRMDKPERRTVDGESFQQNVLAFI